MKINSRPKNVFGFVSATRTPKEFINDLQLPQIAVNQIIKDNNNEQIYK